MKCNDFLIQNSDYKNVKAVTIRTIPANCFRNSIFKTRHANKIFFSPKSDFGSQWENFTAQKLVTAADRPSLLSCPLSARNLITILCQTYNTCYTLTSTVHIHSPISLCYTQSCRLDLHSFCHCFSWTWKSTSACTLNAIYQYYNSV